MAYFHFDPEERARVTELMRKHRKSEYAILRELFRMGLERLDAGEELFGTAPVTPAEEVARRLDKRLNLILEKLHHARARELNMTLELLEHTVWLRTLGEEVKPGGQALVNERVKNAAARVFKIMHVPPAEARGTV